jgi:hypothetical protein
LVVLVFSFIGCSNNKERITELENKIINLQEQLSEKEKTISSLQETEITAVETTATETTPAESEEDLIKKVIENYIKAVGTENFSEQRKYVAEYALDLVNFKEEENRNAIGNEERTFSNEPISNIKFSGNQAEAFMSFTEHLIATDGSDYDVVTEGKVLLKKINNEWKITDYTRKNHLISEAFFSFNDIKFESKDIEITLDYVLFSLSDKYVVVGISIYNGTDKNLKYYSSEAILVGPDKKQSKAKYYNPDLETLLPDSIASGYFELNWDYDSTTNFTVNTGTISDDKGYEYLNNIKLEIDLSKAIRY